MLPAEFKLKDATVILSTILLTCHSCTMLEQHDYLTTKNITEINQEKFMYTVYQTGFDNYQIEFKTIANEDTSTLFNFFINDAVYSDNTFHLVSASSDTLVVSSPHSIQEEFHKTPQGTILKLCPSR